MFNQKSQKQMEQFFIAAQKRHPKAEEELPLKIYNDLRYSLAALTEGICETQARRFLAKINIIPISKNAFYAAQKKLGEMINEYITNFLLIIKNNLECDTIFGLDCSWSARRNAAHAIVVFMDIRTKLIFDYVIVSRNPDVSDIDFYDTSNMMENAAVKEKKDEYLQNYKFIGFVHDFDIDTAPSLQPDDGTGQLIEYLDPGHLKKVVENKFQYHNTDNYLYELKDNILARFNYIVRNRDITVEEKVLQWLDTTNWILNHCEKKGYLIKKKRKRRVSPETAKTALEDFLKDTEWLIRKCGVCDTQAIESFNSIKAKICPKGFAFQKAFRIRCQLAILKWNDKDFFEILDDKLLYDELNDKCKQILKSDKDRLEKSREKAKEVEARIIRNIKRRNARLKNKIKPDGHQYLNDSTKATKREDPTREIALKKLPHITNQNTLNCFINSFVQLFRHTNIENNFTNGKNTEIYGFMKKLNQGENIDQDDINLFRLTISPPFSIGGQEDVSEFVSYILNDIDDSEAYNTNVDDLVFRKAYKYTMEKTLTCQNCDEIVQKYEDSFILHIPCNSPNFISNFEEAFTGIIERKCSKCGYNFFNYSQRFVNSPEYLIVQIMRFKYNKLNNLIEKDHQEIEIPIQFYSKFLNESYHIYGIIYHIGDSSKSGHYLSKHLTYDGFIETFDDARCYSNQIERKLESKNAYLIIFQKNDSFIQNIPDELKRNWLSKQSNQFIEQESQKNISTFSIKIEEDNQNYSKSEKKVDTLIQKKKTKQKRKSSVEKNTKEIKSTPEQPSLKSSNDKKSCTTLKFDEKVRNLFIEYSFYTSMHIFDQMMHIYDEKTFLIMFQLFIDELIVFPLLDIEKLYQFAIDFKKAHIVDKPIEILTTAIIKSGYNINLDSNSKNISILLFLRMLIENKLITQRKIDTVNEEIAQSTNNNDFYYLIKNLEESILAYTLQASLE